MGEHVEGPTEATHDAHQDEDHDLLWIVRKLHRETCREMWDDRLLVIKPDAQHGEGCGADDGCKESSPVVPHSEVDAGHLDAEENSTDRTGKAAGDTNSHGSRQHLRISRLVSVNSLEGGDELIEQSGHNAGNVYEGSLLAKRHPGAESGRQPDNFCHERSGILR